MKLSSEVAESISLTPVVLREMAVHELMEHLLAVTGKDEPRIREILLRGTMVSGASRFRWAGWDADVDGLRELLAGFPDPDPARPFVAARCIRVVLKGRHIVDIGRETASHRGLFRRRTFWDGLMEVAAAQPAAYLGYSYRDRADRYLREFSYDEAKRIRELAGRVKFSTLRDRIRSAEFTQAELAAER